MTNSETVVQTRNPHPRQPRWVLPANACDSHVHIFGPRQRFPYAAGLKVTPAEAPKEALFELHRKMGISRCVIVQSVTHGVDNRVVEDAIEAGGGRYLGVALVPVDVSLSELKRLASKGFRAVRFHFMKHLHTATPVDDVLKSAPLAWPIKLLDVPPISDGAAAVVLTREERMRDHAVLRALSGALEHCRLLKSVASEVEHPGKQQEEDRQRQRKLDEDVAATVSQQAAAA